MIARGGGIVVVETDLGDSCGKDFLAFWRACYTYYLRRHGAIMLIGLAFRLFREPYAKAFVDLPPLSCTKTSAADIDGLRVSLMRALQAVLTTNLHQFGDDESSQCYLVGGRVLQPVLAKSLISHGWVVAGRPHWAEAVVQYRLSADGLLLKSELESWWRALTLGQRCRAAFVE